MKLKVPFVQLPLRFDAERLAMEMRALGEPAWRPHPQNYPGNFALPLISVDGDPASDAIAGPMRPTPYLEQCPYLVQVLARLGAVWGRTRLMKLIGGAEVTPHADINYYWRDRVRVHVPIQTQPGVRFICGDAEVNMAPGECWIFDTWRPHRVINVADQERVHLVADTVGGDAFWEIAAGGRVPGQRAPERWAAKPFAGEAPGSAAPDLVFERVNTPVVMTPWELRDHLQFIFAHVRPDPQAAAAQLSALRFATSWHVLWARYGEASDGWPAYRELLRNFDGWLEAHAGRLQLLNSMPLIRTIRTMVLNHALAGADVSHHETEETAQTPDAAGPSRRASNRYDFNRPVFIVSPPRSGSTLLFETVALSPDVYTIGGESHRLIEVETDSGSLGAVMRGWKSNRLTAEDAAPEIIEELRDRYRASVLDHVGGSPAGAVRLLEKTPKNSLRIPFLSEVFPDALFVYLYRDPREVMASMMEAWTSGRFCTYPGLPGWTGAPWSMVLIPGWQELIGRSLPEIVAAQWSTTTRILLDDFETLPPERRCVSRYDALVAEPDAEVRRLCGELGLRWDRVLGGRLPLARYTLSPPRRGKWYARRQEVEHALAGVAETAERAVRVARSHGERTFA